MRYPVFVAAALCASAGVLPAQSVAQRVAAIRDGRIELTYAARAGTCGDGRNFLRDGFGGEEWSDGNYTTSRREAPSPECEPGPVRVLATVDDGHVVRLRTFVGPVPTPAPDVRRLALSTHDAVAFLSGLAREDGRVASEAMGAIALADSTTPWPLFMRVTDDESLGQAVRRDAAFWLARGVSAKLGLTGAERDATGDDDVRNQAVFALSQQPRDVAVPRLLEVARSRAEPRVRASAVFWLGQTGDPRALRWFGEVLGVR